MEDKKGIDPKNLVNRPGASSDNSNKKWTSSMTPETMLKQKHTLGELQIANERREQVLIKNSTSTSRTVPSGRASVAPEVRGSPPRSTSASQARQATPNPSTPGKTVPPSQVDTRSTNQTPRSTSHSVSQSSRAQQPNASSKTQVTQENKCNYCNTKFTDRRKYARHEKDRKERKCGSQSGCKVLFCSIKERDEHRKKAHSGEVFESSGAFKCSRCGQTFMRHDRLVKYFLSHTYTYVCGRCNFVFKNPESLIRHENAYNRGDWSCQVENCNQKFCSKTLLLQHHKTGHPGVEYEKPDHAFPCKYCVKGFSTKPLRDSHIKQCHSDPSQIDSDILNASIDLQL